MIIDFEAQPGAEFELHDYCTIFPEMPEDEYEELKNDIRARGLIHPVTVIGDEVVNGEVVYRILDGRHRYTACMELGIVPDYVEFVGPGSALEFVFSANMKRRDLTKGQKAMVLTKGLEAERRRAKERQQQAGASYGRGMGKLPANLPEPIKERGETRDILAAAAGVSPRTAQDVITVIDSKDADLIAEVKEGRMAPYKAAAEVRERQKIERTKPKMAEFITLDDWNAMPLSERASAFATPSADKLNRQDNTSIEWAQWSWNPITGCRHDCPYCYARDIANRFYDQKFEPSILPSRFACPGNTNVPERAASDPAYRNVFTCSMADLFGRWVPAEWINRVLATITANPDWNFLLLTKFANRMAEFQYPQNAWLGTSVDLQARVGAAEKAMEKFEAHVKWLSIEPLIEPITFKRPELFNWVVIGGASKSVKTPDWQPPFEWVARLYMTFKDAGAAVYIKDNIGFDGPRRPREFPWVDIKAESAADVFHYLKGRKDA